MTKNRTAHIITIVSLVIFMALGLASGGGTTGAAIRTENSSGGQGAGGSGQAARTQPSGGNPSTPARTVKTAAVDELDIAIRDASDYLNDNILAGSMIVILNVQSNSAALSDYIIDELIANAVNDRIFEVVDRQQLDLIRTEQNFQLSGEVDDNLALSIGKFIGAQIIVSGRVSQVGDRYRMTIRALDVQTARVQGQYNRNIAAGATITALMASGGSGGRVQSAPAGTATTSSGRGGSSGSVQVNSQTTKQPATQPAAREQNFITVEGGATLAEKLQWIRENAVSNTEYRIEVKGSGNISAQTLSYSGRRNVTVRLTGSGWNNVISLTGNGSLFTVDANVTLILDSGVTLEGHSRNNAPLVKVNNLGTLAMNTGAKVSGNTNPDSGAGVYVDGTFTMTGGEITGSRASSGGGVYVEGTFTMKDGAIFGNTVDSNGGGVYVASGGRFTMEGGEISGNIGSGLYSSGAGVYVGGTFTMTGGEISSNRSSSRISVAYSGGGVYVNGRFTMTGGEISGNTAGYGGGVFVMGTFTMEGGEISGNTADSSGGGVWVYAATFTKTGGTIYGFTAGDGKSNTATGSGHAVSCYGGGQRRNSTAGPGVRMDTRGSGAAGGWDN